MSSMKEKNYIPKEMEGAYELYLYGNKIVLKKQGVRPMYSVVKCHPEDEFNISEGMKIAFDRLEDCRKIKNGDRVILLEGGNAYPYYVSFIREHELDNEVLDRFGYSVTPKAKTICRVLYNNDNLYVVEAEKDRTVYIVDKNSFKKIW